MSIAVWVLMGLNQDEGDCSDQPTPSVYASKDAALRTWNEGLIDEIDENEDEEEQRAAILKYISELEREGTCLTEDGWFISLTEETVQS